MVLRWFCFKTDYATPWSMVSQQKGYCSHTPPKQNIPLLYFTSSGISDPSWHIPTPRYKAKLTQRADYGTTTLQCCTCCLLLEQHSLKNCRIFQIYRIWGSLRITSAPAEMTFLYRTNQLARSSLNLLNSLRNIQVVSVWMAEFTVQTLSTLPKPWSTLELSSTRLHSVLKGIEGAFRSNSRTSAKICEPEDEEPFPSKSLQLPWQGTSMFDHSIIYSIK